MPTYLRYLNTPSPSSVHAEKILEHPYLYGKARNRWQPRHLYRTAFSPMTDRLVESNESSNLLSKLVSVHTDFTTRFMDKLHIVTVAKQASIFLFAALVVILILKT